MKINKNINTTVICDDNLFILNELKNEVIVNKLEDLKDLKTSFVVFNDFLRLLNNHEKEILLSNLEKKHIHFLNITSDIEEALLASELKVVYHGRVMLEGSTLSVLKEERLLKRLGYKIPFVVDLSLQLNAYKLIDSIFLDEEVLVDKLW